MQEKIVTYTTVTDPIQMGFPIFEAVKSYLSFSDEVLLVVGRDTENFCQQISKISEKIVCFKTDLWPERWTYDDMTYHINLGLQEANGDIVVKIDADSIFPDQNGEAIKTEIINKLLNHNYCHFDRLNYYHNYGYSRKSGKTFFAVNKRRMLLENIKFEIGTPNNSNVLLINGQEPHSTNETRITDINLIPRNYDDTFCSMEQAARKWYNWSLAHPKWNPTQASLYETLDINNADHLTLVIKEWKVYKRMKARCSVPTKAVHPDIVSEKLLKTSSIF